jgi:hypothetical protein
LVSLLQLYFLRRTNLFRNYTGLGAGPAEVVQDEPAVIPRLGAHVGDGDDEGNAVAGPRVLAHTNMAKTISKLPLWSFDICLRLHDI